MIHIVWFFAFMGAGGPVTGPVTDTIRFDTAMACQAHGEAYRERAAAMVRGAFGLDPSVKIQIAFQCMAGDRDA